MRTNAATTHFARARRRQQSGAALIVSLILLMVLTVLAISTMRTASLQLLMAGNVQYRENAYRLAHAGIDAALRRPLPVGIGDCTAPLVADPAVPVPELEPPVFRTGRPSKVASRISRRGSYGFMP